MPLNNQDIGEALVKHNYVSQEEMDIALADAKKAKENVVEVLINQGLMTPHLFESALAEHYKLEFFDIQSAPPDTEAVSKLPEEIARKYNCIVTAFTKKNVTIATCDPLQENLEEVLRANIGVEEAILPEKKTEKDSKKTTKKRKKSTSGFSLFGSKKDEVESSAFTGKIAFVYSPKTGIESMFLRYRKPLITRFQTIIDEEGEVAPEILTEIINDAIQLRASDIHFEPQGDEQTLVRFRVDGVMHEAGRIPKIYYEGVVNRVKIESNMRIDEHFTPQDGAIRHTAPDGAHMDIRVSIVPVVDGEKIVMRILASYVRSLTLKDLGFSDENQEILEKASHKPFGMLLTTGPTGSGKSTTLYSLIIIRNTPDINISTIEDPVEYKIAGINHIQANEAADLTFAKGLRALVRQDPDIILVGEIRDGETANISVNAALTGHLLFSTLHSNDAATAIPRMLDMGVEPFLLASTLEVIIGQRLVRRICPQCRYSYSVKAAEAKKMFAGAKDFFTGKGAATLYQGKGCDACGGTGYRGRIGIHELLVVTPEIEELIITEATSTDINKLARSQGMKLMFEDGFAKAMAGQTTLEELMRMAAPPEVALKRQKKSSKK